MADARGYQTHFGATAMLGRENTYLRSLQGSMQRAFGTTMWGSRRIKRRVVLTICRGSHLTMGVVIKDLLVGHGRVVQVDPADPEDRADLAVQVDLVDQAEGDPEGEGTPKAATRR